ncbi:hypothetical protein CTI12_AA553780 [Artemisia annua]|uniref:FBD domain-containing protein n=1 Tax=Artemisia annua TaxID=35608 RepID=A0A2U1KSP3_ARTAN|nr:hypothetical protein CTI12_AA553780 [Artemisia annua]
MSRFSDDNLISILSCMPIKDAAVTSKLAKRWRYLWCERLVLDLKDKERLAKIGANQNTCLQEERKKYISWVDSVIRSGRSGTLGEVTVILSGHSSSERSISIVEPLKNCSYGKILEDDHHDIGLDDQLSRFSDDNLISILSCMPIKDAAVTSKLAKRWRYLWCERLVLDPKDKERLAKIGANQNTCLQEERKKYISWVDSVISQHKSTSIEKFRICFPLGKNSKGAIGKWIQFAFSKKVKTLVLNLKNAGCGDDRRNIVFPNKIFDIKSGSSLTQESFHLLNALVLKYVNVNDEGLTKILTNCQALEHLSINSSILIVKPKIHGEQLQLKTLVIEYCAGLESIEICDCNIESFTCISSPATLKCKNLEKLEKMFIDGNYYLEKDNLFDEIYCYISNLLVLELHLHRPRVLPLPVLPKLKQLILNVGAWQDSCYLALTPVLIWFAPEMIIRKMKELNTSTHQHLEVVEIRGYYGRTSDLELAMHFMRIGVALKKLVIDPKSPNARRLTKEDKIKEEDAARCCAHQHLKPITPVGLELVIL